MHKWREQEERLDNGDSTLCSFLPSHTLSIKIAQKPYIIGFLGPKALKYESFEGKGY